MYRAEKMMDGVLHYKTTPDGDWTPYSIEDLSILVVRGRDYIMAKEKELAQLRDELYYLKEELSRKK